MGPDVRVRCRLCGAVLPGFFSITGEPNGAILLQHLGAMHRGEVNAYLDRMHRTEDIAPVAAEACEEFTRPSVHANGGAVFIVLPRPLPDLRQYRPKWTRRGAGAGEHLAVVVPQLQESHMRLAAPRSRAGETIMPRPSALVLGLLMLAVLALAGLTVPGFADADVNDLRPGPWSGGVGAGFLTNTPDGVEFALKGHVDYSLIRGFSVGLLGQATLGGNDHVFGLSAQAKYWWDIPGRRQVVKVVVQGGIGFVGAAIDDTDSGVSDTYTSFLIPVGIGLESTVTKRIVVTGEFLLNFTSLGDNVRAGGREVDLHTHVMPGFYLGVRF
jgi:hypothetical protein